MFGAILGDIIGSPYKFDMGDKMKDFPMFVDGSGFRGSGFTDDTVMTISVAEALMKAGPDANYATIKECIIDAMHYWDEKYPDAGYGQMAQSQPVYERLQSMGCDHVWSVDGCDLSLRTFCRRKRGKVHSDLYNTSDCRRKRISFFGRRCSSKSQRECGKFLR